MGQVPSGDTPQEKLDSSQPSEAGNPAYVYILRCGDGTLYTGVARDVERRLKQHRSGKGARYTRGRGPLAREAEIKRWTRSRKERLIVGEPV